MLPRGLRFILVPLEDGVSIFWQITSPRYVGIRTQYTPRLVWLCQNNFAAWSEGPNICGVVECLSHLQLGQACELLNELLFGGAWNGMRAKIKMLITPDNWKPSSVGILICNDLIRTDLSETANLRSNISPQVWASPPCRFSLAFPFSFPWRNTLARRQPGQRLLTSPVYRNPFNLRLQLFVEWGQ